MHIGKLLHKIFVPASLTIDKRVHRSLLKAALTLTDCRHLSIAGIGRCLLSSAAVKHTIKPVDRLFGNPRLDEKRVAYYQMMVNLLIGNHSGPVILID